MLPYWLLFAILASGAMLHGAAPDIQVRSRPLLIAAGVMMALMIGLRYEVGPDWPTYAIIFELTKTSADLGRGDPAFYFILAFVHKVGGEIWLVNLICGSIFVYGLVAFSRRQWNPWLSVLVIFPYLGIVVAMSGTRQSAAIGLFFLALNAFRDKSLSKFVLFIGLASLFHASAALMAPICALSYSRSKLLSLLLVSIIALTAYYTLSSSFDTYATRYGSSNIQSSGVIYRVVLNALPALIFLKYGDKFLMDKQERSLWRTFSILALLSAPLALALSSSTAVDRFALYLFPLQSVVLARFPWVSARTTRELKIAFVSLAGYSAAILIVYLNFSQFGSLFIPYRMFFLNGETSYVTRL